MGQGRVVDTMGKLWVDHGYRRVAAFSEVLECKALQGNSGSEEVRSGCSIVEREGGNAGD